ncbi:MAG: transporter substrate-binding domain-containing protein [Coriobacteriales bacterium]|jgi:polar amino acid transport system substrate-binding protein|nr:transporter substrate-binding domain-containing protein [Coriobacteriales bacterium]
MIGRRFWARALVITTVLALAGMGLTGCAGATGSRQLPLSPTVSTPAIGQAGVLKVGVDSKRLAPFTSSYQSGYVGMDVDIAAAIADRLGLRLQLVDIAGKSADDLLNSGEVDMVMSLEQSGNVISQGRVIGPYVYTAPALFMVTRSNTVPSVDLQTLKGTTVVAQKDSLSAWTVDELIGANTSRPLATLSDVFDAVGNGQSTYAAADAIIGSYLTYNYDPKNPARYRDISCVKLLGTPTGVYIGVSKTNSQLADVLTTTLRTIRDNGELGVILNKWLGPVSSTVVMNTQAIVSQSASDAIGPSQQPSSTIGAQGTEGTDVSAGLQAPDDQAAQDTGDDLPDPSNAGDGTQ